MKTNKLDKLIYGSSIFVIIGFYLNKISTIMNFGYYHESNYNFIMIPVFLIVFLVTYLLALYILANLVIIVEVCIYTLKKFNNTISHEEEVIKYKNIEVLYLSNKQYINNMVFRC